MRQGALAWFDTQHVPVTDGSETWKALACSRNAPEQQWTCGATSKKGLRVTLPSISTELVVDIPLALWGEAARPMVTLGFPQIRSMERSQVCNREPVGASQHEAITQTFSRVKGAELRLAMERGGFALVTGPYSVHFDYDLSRDPMPKLRCWSPGDTLE